MVVAMTWSRVASGVIVAAGCIYGAVAHAQAAACDEGVIRLPDRSGTVQICSALAAQVPLLARQLSEATRSLGDQQAQLRELTRLVRGLNGAGQNLGPERQATMLRNLSSELGRAQRGGDAQTKRAVENISEQLETLREQMLLMLQSQSAAATTTAIRGSVGDSIAKLEFASAARQLDEISAQLRNLKSQVGDVKADTQNIRSGVNTANEKLDRVVTAVDPSLAADRCADLTCAVYEQAGVDAVRRLFQRGARLPVDKFNQGGILLKGLVSRARGRLEIMDLLHQNGLDRNAATYGSLSSNEMTQKGAQVARMVKELSKFDSQVPGDTPEAADFNSMMMCFNWKHMFDPNRRSDELGMTALEFASIVGDYDMVAHLMAGGSKLPQRPLVCTPNRFKPLDSAQVVFDPRTAHVRSVQAKR